MPCAQNPAPPWQLFIQIFADDGVIRAIDGIVDLGRPVEVVLFHFVGREPDELVSSQTLHLSLRSILAHVPWRTGPIYIISDNAALTRSHFKNGSSPQQASDASPHGFLKSNWRITHCDCYMHMY